MENVFKKQQQQNGKTAKWKKARKWMGAKRQLCKKKTTKL